eukprot:TRINITY_DN3898_c0_g1_i1.p1 TRINITY_DN3898_c0_g1~~TRINITY_DN3898_c0_g1_i1.p1  ORF type:complete len:495 (-),score=87.23 TRINITY_DN3898_c0_g1_i1:690-2174(-)
MWNILLLGFIAFFLWGLLCWLRDYRTFSHIPGPTDLPFVYGFFRMYKNKKRMYEAGLDGFNQYGTTWTSKISWARHRHVFTIDPKNIVYILQDNFDNYVKGAGSHKVLSNLLGEGIFNVNGESWRSQRQIASHLFKIRELRGMAETFLLHGEQLVDILRKNQGKVVDTQDLFSSLTLDSIGEIAFGVPIGSLQHPVPFSKAFNQAQVRTALRSFRPFWDLLDKYDYPLHDAIKVLDDFAYGVIAEERAKIEQEKKESPDHSVKEGEKINLLRKYLIMTDENGQPFTNKYIRDIIMNFTIAGRDTTAQTLTWAFYLLSQNPRVLQEAKNHVAEELGDNKPSYEDCTKGLRYLEAIMNETLRLYPPVPIDSKTTVKDDVLPSGARVTAGTIIIYHIWSLGRYEKYWKRAEEFWPERWLEEGGDAPKKQQPPFIPFNYGRRTCLGMNMAYLEAKMVMALILQSGLDLVVESGYVPQYQHAITISVRDGMKMIPREAK